MQLDQLIDGLPGHAKDLKLNYSSLVRQNTELTKQQLWGTVVASAIATRNPELTAAALEEGAKQLSAQEFDAAKAAAAV
ncbi:MAG TPA: alkyl hydroperoxide reductase, partial [Alloacidobacterium sp.]|nr:alkyl hydroperoxide reductase [Alloacidobacterium sp.]